MVLNKLDWPSRGAASKEVSVEADTKLGVMVAHVKSLTSKASSLGATSPSAAVLKMAIEKAENIKCVTIPDEMSMHTAALFAGQ